MHWFLKTIVLFPLSLTHAPATALAEPSRPPLSLADSGFIRTNFLTLEQDGEHRRWSYEASEFHQSSGVSDNVHKEEAPADDDPWQFQITPYMFLPDVDGDATVQGVTAPLDLDFHDLVELLDTAFSFRFVAQKRNWGLFANLEYMDLYGSGRPLVNPLKVRADIEDFSVDLGIIYRPPPLPLGGCRPSSEFQPTLRFEPFGGLRYHYLKQHIIASFGPLRPPRLGTSKDWVEPFLGGIVGLSLTKQFTLLVRGDIGGFGIGSASDLTWNLWTGADYAFTDRVSVKFGYRIMDLDYSTGSGFDKFGFDATFKGPFIGLTYRF